MIRRFCEGDVSRTGAGDDDYIRFREEHPEAWVISNHRLPAEMLHQIRCNHFYDDQPSTKDPPKLVATTRDALQRVEPRFPEIRRCMDCG
jgi:hypothetical protein